MRSEKRSRRGKDRILTEKKKNKKEGTVMPELEAVFLNRNACTGAAYLWFIPITYFGSEWSSLTSDPRSINGDRAN